jgi:hypothetical protein
MKTVIVQEIDLARSNLAVRSLSRIDFADAFKCQLPKEHLQTVDSVTRAIFATIPPWIAGLLQLRNAIVRPLGLKTTVDAVPANSQDKLQPGIAVGIFKVLDRRQNEEIMLGEDDQHLDFRVSVHIEREAEEYWVVVSTAVKFNNWLGRAYFIPIKPVHKIIVPAMMKHGLSV